MEHSTVVQEDIRHHVNDMAGGQQAKLRRDCRDPDSHVAQFVIFGFVHHRARNLHGCTGRGQGRHGQQGRQHRSRGSVIQYIAG